MSGDSELPSRVVDVVVIGGGLSGLASARLLAGAGADVVVLEARDRVGGRTCTQTTDGVPADVGGAYVGVTQNRVLSLAKEMRMSIYPIQRTGTHVLYLHGSRQEHSDTIPPLSPFRLLDLNNAMVLTHNLANSDSSGALPQPSGAHGDLDNITVEGWLRDNTWTSSAREVYGLAVKSILAACPSQVSMLAWLQYVKSGHGLDILTDHAQNYKFVEGAQEISVRLSKRLRHRVVLSSPVRSVKWGTAVDDIVTVRTRAGGILRAKYAIIAMAPSMYGRLTFSPPLPPLRSQLSTRMPMGSIIKTVTYYETAWWREDGFSGSAAHDSGPVIYTYDDTKCDGSHPSLMGFILADHCAEMVGHSLESRREAVIRQYAVVFRNPKALSPIRYIEKNWCAEEFSGGCYTGVMPPRVLTECGKVLAEPMGNVHFAGTETATEWRGYMDGAVEAGERAAYEVTNRLVDDISRSGEPPRLLVPSSPPSHPVSHLIPEPQALHPTALERCLPSLTTLLTVGCGVLLLGVAASVYDVRGRRWRW